MSDNEYGPFDNERQALATRSAALIRAAYEAHPGVGASVPECLKIMTDACEAHGVALGMLDMSFLRGVAWGETFYSVSLTGMITRAYQAGAAAREGAVTEWGVTLEGGGNEPFASAADEGDARQVAASFPRSRAVVVRREVTPWTPVPGEDEGNAPLAGTP